MPFAIETQDLSRVFKIRHAKKGEEKTLEALQNVTARVEQGELFGLLGPNGAGKTTLIKILTTLLAPSSGIAKVAGLDVVEQAGLIRQRINMVSGGETSGYGLLTVRENLWMFSQFYGIPGTEANARIKTLLELVGLSDRANTRSSNLSTGMRQKMNIVRGFLTDPEVLFLDEPTLGLDVGAARDVRQLIRYWMKDDPRRSVLLTTHYLVEAEELCDRVAIINKGRLLACDTPSALKQRLQKEVIFRLEMDTPQPLNSEAFNSLAGLNAFHITSQNGVTSVDLMLAEEAALAAIIAALSVQNARILSLQKRQPSLEDVFINLVGASMAEVEHADTPAA